MAGMAVSLFAQWNRALCSIMAEAPTTEEVDYYVDTIADVSRAEIRLTKP